MKRIVSALSVAKSNKISLYYKSNYAVTNWLNLNAGVDVRMGRSYTPNSGYTSYTLQQRYERILDADGNHYTSPYVNVDTSPSYNGSVVRKKLRVSHLIERLVSMYLMHWRKA